MRYLFKSPPKENNSAIAYPQSKDRPQDWPAAYVNSQQMTLEEALAHQFNTLEANQRKSGNLFETGSPVWGYAGKKGYRKRHFATKIDTLKNLSQSSIPSRAISILRNGISNLDFSIRPKDNKLSPTEQKEYESSISIARRVIENPNGTDDDFSSFLGQIIEDIVVFDAGCWEYVEHPLYSNGVLGLEVVPGCTISQNENWDGDPEKIRWAQSLGTGNEIQLLDKDLEYLMARKRSWSLYGYSKLETAMEILDSFFRVSSFQRETASEAFPSFLLWLGENMAPADVNRMRAFWNMELTGRGTPGFWANTEKPEVVNLKTQSDDGLFLRYTELLIRVVAFCFDLKPQDFGLERDVNRSTAESSRSASVDEALKPMAKMIAARMNVKVLPRIALIVNDPKISLLKFSWIGIDPRDEKQESEIVREEFKADLITLDEARARKDLPPIANGMGQFTYTAYTETVKFDPELLLSPDAKDLIDKLREGNPLLNDIKTPQRIMDEPDNMEG